MITFALLALGALVHYSPEHMASAFGGTVSAWEYVAGGVEAACLWLIIARLLPIATPVCAWFAIEGAERAVFRLLLPMDRPPRPPAGQTLGDVVAGPWTSWIGITAVFLATAYAARGLAHGHANTGR